jgi:hypothetical protein
MELESPIPPPVIIESPYAGDVEANVAYAKRCVQDSLDRGEAPFASHLFYPLFLDDNDQSERTVGISCGKAWLLRALRMAVYCDRGISPGMAIEMAQAKRIGLPVEFRYLEGRPEEKVDV